MNSFSSFTKTIAATGLGLASAVCATLPAQAFTLTFDPGFGTSNNQGTGATAQVKFNFEQKGSDVLLNLDIFNTTKGSSFLDGTNTAGATASTFMGFAFDLISGVSVKSFTGNSFFGNYLTNVSLPPYEQYDVGVSKNNNFIGGGPNGGLTAGKNTTVSFVLSTALSALDVETNFWKGFADGSLDSAARFQAVNAGAGSDKLLGGLLAKDLPPAPQPPVVQPPAPQPPVVVNPPVDEPPVVQPPVEEPPVVQPPVVVNPPSEEEFEYDRSKEVPEPSLLAGLGLAFGTMLKISRRKQNA
ncbi:PEP-CTERM sorting domain-containing protein [Oscillatoria amoena NRMC-F 0135]|nr:PEP-CTERM sorting domain-containing protein [Geitlerinema splendidum]MDL5045610.1 PEP-CTERM sorting domain-containing protein [Oscillatoria amoena NRMC-F 0135]